MKVNFGLEEKVIDKIVAGLSEILANNYLLYFKTLNAHWNMEDPRFYSLHLMLQKQYEALAEAGDELAERIRQLGRKTPGTMKEMLELGSVREGNSRHSADEMLKDLSESHENSMQLFRKVIGTTDEFKDQGTSDLLAGLLRDHEKAAWILRSHL